MHAHHDLTDAIRTRDVTAVVRDREDGYHELVLNGEVHAADWDRVQHLSGMSVTIFVPLPDADPNAEITLAADAGWFDDADIATAAARVASHAPTASARAYQFGLIADPQIFVELSLAMLQGMGPTWPPAHSGTRSSI